MTDLWVEARRLAESEGRDWATLSGCERRFWRDVVRQLQAHEAT